MHLRWDDLDAQRCADDGVPDWTSMIVVGPTKVRDGHGNVSLQWTVTVQCRPTAPAVVPVPAAPADVEPVLPPSTVTAA
jgi:hypothetical protein